MNYHIQIYNNIHPQSQSHSPISQYAPLTTIRVDRQAGHPDPQRPQGLHDRPVPQHIQVTVDSIAQLDSAGRLQLPPDTQLHPVLNMPNRLLHHPEQKIAQRVQTGPGSRHIEIPIIIHDTHPIHLIVVPRHQAFHNRQHQSLTGQILATIRITAQPHQCNNKQQSTGGHHGRLYLR